MKPFRSHSDEQPTEPKQAVTDEVGSAAAQEQSHREKALGIARDARFCMLTVHDADGALVSRPMTPLEVSDEAELWFLIDRTSGQAGQIVANAQVNLGFAQASTWLSISGRGKLMEDPAKVAALWNPAAEAWFPDGPDDPRLTALRVRGRTAHYWDTPGGRLATALSFVKAKATGQALEAENEVVRLR